MVDPGAAKPDPVILHAMREYRLSLAIFVAGILLLLAYLALTFGAYLTGNYPVSSGLGLALTVISTAGFMFLLLGGTVAYFHRRFLLQNRSDS